MITKEKLETYKYYKGDIDGWSKTKSKKDNMVDEDWYEIDSLIQEYQIIEKGLASEEFIQQFKIKFDYVFTDPTLVYIFQQIKN